MRYKQLNLICNSVNISFFYGGPRHKPCYPLLCSYGTVWWYTRELPEPRRHFESLFVYTVSELSIHVLRANVGGFSKLPRAYVLTLTSTCSRRYFSRMTTYAPCRSVYINHHSDLEKQNIISINISTATIKPTQSKDQQQQGTLPPTTCTPSSIKVFDPNTPHQPKRTSRCTSTPRSLLPSYSSPVEPLLLPFPSLLVRVLRPTPSSLAPTMVRNRRM